MTIDECIGVADEVTPNGVTRPVKLQWLFELEGKIHVELLGEAPEAVIYPTAEQTATWELIAPPPFDRMYWMYLVSMVACLRGDTERYEMAAALFNEAYLAYGKWLRREGA